MALPLFVLVHAPNGTGWYCVAGPTDQAGATDAVNRVIAERPAAKVAVLQLVRSFTGAIVVKEDAAATADP